MRFVIFTVAVSFFVSPVLAGGHLASEREGKKDRFAATDTNGDNQISKAEFIALAEKRFAKMDKNGDGVLSKDEMKSRRGHAHGKQ